MAIDGVKIIDSDSAHDIYNEVVESWKDGKPVSDILSRILASEKDFCYNAWETEIYWTALAYSLWKIGHLPNEIRDKTLDIISQGACEEWLKIDPSAQKLRQKALDELAEKILTPNSKPIRRPKLPKTQSEPLFTEGEVLVIALPDGQYGACVLVMLDRSPRKLDYHFSVVDLRKSKPPSIDDVCAAPIAFRKTLGFDASIWTDHKTLLQVQSHLQSIGQVELIYPRMGTYSPGVGYEDFFRCFDAYQTRKKSQRPKTYPLNDLIKHKAASYLKNETSVA